MADTYITNITTSTTDTNGNNLIGSNDVLSVYYYDVTATGIAWKTEWNIAPPVSNSSFQTTITGSAWQFETDAPGSMHMDRFAAWKSTDLVAGLTVTSSGAHFPYADDYLTDYYNDYGWETSNADEYGAFAATIDMGSTKDFNYVYILPGWDESDNTKFLRGYRIGVSDTGNENDFTIVASGTTSGSLAPEIAFVGNDVSGRYVKLYVDTNYGSSSYTRVGKFSVFNDPDWSLFGFRNAGAAGGGSYAEWKQSVNFSNIDYLFFDVRGYNTNTYQVGEIEIVIDSDVVKTYNWANTGAVGWKDTANDDGWWTRWEEMVDVSGYVGVKTLEAKMWSGSYDRTAFMGFLDDFNVQPRWSNEPVSASRGATSEFPSEVFIIADREGVSILDKSDNTLWMRFDVGPSKGLEAAARDIFAADGKIYLATSRGLVVLDFVDNRIWKYDETGVYYRMSIAKRNEYAFWFTETTLDVLASSDIYSVSGGYWRESAVASEDTLNILVGTGAGISVIFPSNTYSSSFSYPIRKIRLYDSRIVYLGGFENLSKIGIIDDMDALWSDSFDEQISMYSQAGMLHGDSFDNVISNQWEQDDGDLPISIGSGYFTISGTKTDYGDTVLIQKEFVPNRSFTASADVRIKDWSDRVEGGLRFGVTSGWPYDTDTYNDPNKALMMGAINGITGPYIQNESLYSFPSPNNWIQNFTDFDGQTIEIEDNSYKVSGLLGGSYGTSNSIGPVTGSKYTWPSMPSFIARLKVKVTDFYDVDVGRVFGFIFGVTDGQYLGEGTGTTGLAMALHGDNADPNPPVYCTAHKTNDSGWIWNTTASGVLLSGDGTTSANWHQWEIRYDEPSNTLYGSVDGVSVGSIAYGSIGSDLGIVFGPVGNQVDNVEVYYKDFEIDFGEFVGNQKKKYVLHSYDSGTWTIPTLSGTHLGGIDFSATDGTESAAWKTWTVTYDGTTLSGSVGGALLGSAVTDDLGEHPRLFFAYDAPATLSGSNKSVEVNIRNFEIEYEDEHTVASGSPNSFYLENGSYAAIDYNTLYLATTSGIEQLMYASTTTVSGVPSNRYFFSTQNGGAGDRAIIHGNIKNCSAVEPAAGAVGPQGLLYVGTSRYKNMGWDRLKDRPSIAEADLGVSIGCTTDGSKLIASINRSGSSAHYIYLKDLGVNGSDWYPIGQALATVDFQDVQDSRVFGWDLEDGNLYFVGPLWFGKYSLANNKWLNSDTNLGTGGVGTGGGAQFDDGETAVVLTKAQIYLAHYSDLGVFSLKENNWRWGKAYYCNDELPLDTADPVIVYSDVDNSLYLMQYQTEGTSNFFKMPLNTKKFSSALEDCPVPFDFDKGISGFYRPYDESIYFLMLGSNSSVGRKLVRYDVKQEQWEAWGIDVPATAYDYLTCSYSYVEDAMFVVVGSESTRVYKYSFPRDAAPRYTYWSATDSVLPESSTAARFNRVSFSSGYVVGSDSFSDSEIGNTWNVFTSFPTTTTITEDDTKVRFYSSYSANNAQAVLGSIALMAPCDFTLTAKVKITDVRKSDDVANNNNFLIGISDFKGTPGYYSVTIGDSEMGETMAGVNGLWMMAFNDKTTSERYSIWKREQGADTKYTSTAYELFNGTDGTPLAEYRDWKIEYTHSTSSLSAYIDDNLIGSTSLAGTGFKHGASINVGSVCEGTSISGELIVDVKDLVIDTDDAAAIVSNYLKLDDLDYSGYNYYEKYESTLSSGVDYTFETNCRFYNDSVTSNVYLSSIGCVEDGHKKALLAAISTGTRQIGIYSGGDPTNIASYTGLTAQDWSLQSTYSIVHDDDRLRVYVDGSSSPSIDMAYTDLPSSLERRVRFGSLNPYESELRHHFDKNEHKVTVSGTWAHDTTRASAYYGDCSTKAATSSDAIIFRFGDVGDASVYAFYSANSGAADDAPFTIYHGGVVTLPVADSYATNPINTVYDNVNESGATDPNTTTIDINQTKIADGAAYNSILANGVDTPSGWVYLGTYTDVDRVVITGNATADTVFADTIKLSKNLDQPQAVSTTRVYSVGYTVGETEMKTGSDYKGSFSVLDMYEKILVDAYNDETTPDIVDSDIADLDVMV